MPNRLIQNVFHWILLKDISGCPQTSTEWKISKSYQLLLHQLQAHQTLLYWVLPSKRSLSSFLASLLSFLNCLSISALILFCSFCSSLKQQAIFIYLLSSSLPHSPESPRITVFCLLGPGHCLVWNYRRNLCYVSCIYVREGCGLGWCCKCVGPLASQLPLQVIIEV